MKLNELKPKEGSTFKKMVVGRGIGSGKGKTCGRGVKGQKARTGVSINGFEGGQMPLYRRLPKRGFNNIFRREYAELNLTKLQAAIDAKTLDAKVALNEKVLVAAGVVRQNTDGVKLLGGGDLKAKLDITVTAATKSAIAAVEKAGGKITILAVPKKDAAPAKGAKAKKSKKAEDEGE